MRTITDRRLNELCVAVCWRGYRHEEDDPLGPARQPFSCASRGRRAGAATEPSKGRAQPAAKITEEQAKKIALEQIPGKVTDVTIEKKGGKNVYVIEIQSPDQGEKDVVDIETGKIIGTD